MPRVEDFSHFLRKPYKFSHGYMYLSMWNDEYSQNHVLCLSRLPLSSPAKGWLWHPCVWWVIYNSKKSSKLRSNDRWKRNGRDLKFRSSIQTVNKCASWIQAQYVSSSYLHEETKWLLSPYIRQHTHQESSVNFSPEIEGASSPAGYLLKIKS